MKAVSHFAFTRNDYERVWLDDEHTSCTHKFVRQHLYEVELVDDELLRVTRDGESKTILVRPDKDGYTYNCMKTYIRSRGLAKGLFDTLAWCIHDDGTVWNSATLYTVCDHIINDMKPAPKRPPMTMNYERVLDALKWSASDRGRGVSLPFGWIARAEYGHGMSYAELWHSETRTTLTYPLASLDGDLKRDEFLRIAAGGLVDRYEDLTRKAA